jgi:hypothetical protein
MDVGYFYFYKPGSDRIISCRFIVAEKSNEMLVKHYEALKYYLNNNNFRNIGNPRRPT